jgi:hypothetical protein
MSESAGAVVGVYDSMKGAEAAVRALLDQGVPSEQVSIVGQDLHSETQVHGFITTGDVAKTGAKTGAWVGGLFGVLTGAAGEGAAAGGGLGAVLGHFIAKKHVPKYTQHLEAGNYLVLRHQPQSSDTKTLQQDTSPIEVEHHEDLIATPNTDPR